MFVAGQHDGVFVGAGGEEGEQNAKRMKQGKKAEFLGCVEAREDWTGRQGNKMRRKGAGPEVGDVGCKGARSEAVEEGGHGFLDVAVDGRGLHNALPRVDVLVVGKRWVGKRMVGKRMHSAERYKLFRKISGKSQAHKGVAG